MKARLLVLFIFALVGSTLNYSEEVDLEAVHKIKKEAFAHSRVMDIMFELTDVRGSRVTGSPGYKAASLWAAEEMAKWGLANSTLEKWGEFGRGWSFTDLRVKMLAPTEQPLTGIPMAWCSGTRGAVSGEVVYAPFFEDRKDPAKRDIPKKLERIAAYAEEHKGKLKGKIVLFDLPRDFEQITSAPSRRHDSESLASYGKAPEPVQPMEVELPLVSLPMDRAEAVRMLAYVHREEIARYWKRMDTANQKLHAFLRDEGIKAILRTDTRGHGGVLFTEEFGSHAKGAPMPPATIVLLPEQYNRIHRLVEKEVTVKVEVNLDAGYHDDGAGDYNVIAELPGGSKGDQVVMMGAHLDSWHAATGATDNAAGSAVVMEAMRILKTLDMKMDRTVRVALWGGEEQGLYGSRGYVKKHFADPATMEVTPEHGKLSAYLNLDNGGGKIRGVHLQGNDMARPIFEAWLAPFKDMDATTVTIRNTFGTDHLSYDAVGLPGFQFVQDPLEYRSATHHSNVDGYDRIVPADLMQAAAIMASMAYHAATREEMLPREPLPDPAPELPEGSDE